MRQEKKERITNPDKLKEGDQVEFKYMGLVDDDNRRQKGVVVMRPEVRWKGGQCPVEDYTRDLDRMVIP